MEAQKKHVRKTQQVKTVKPPQTRFTISANLKKRVLYRTNVLEIDHH
jgi:hypothetical protein